MGLLTKLLLNPSAVCFAQMGDTRKIGMNTIRKTRKNSSIFTDIITKHILRYRIVVYNSMCKMRVNNVSY